MRNIGLQLYSIKEETNRDFLGTLKKVAQMGYDGVQFAGFFDTPAKTVKEVLSNVGLRPAGSHTGYHLLVSDELPKTLEYNYELGNQLIICPYLGAEIRTTLDDYKRIAEVFNRVGEICKRDGFQFAYHNHAYEFESHAGKTGYQILLEETDPQLVQYELDCFWVAHSGIDPASFIEEHHSRFITLHIKDMKEEAGKRVSTEVGHGQLDIQAIVEKGKKAGVSWFVIEQEEFERNPLEAVEMGFNHLQQLI